VRVIVAKRSSGPPASGKIIKEMPGSVASGTTYVSFGTCGRVKMHPLVHESVCQMILRG
jgi:hypothetical protein